MQASVPHFEGFPQLTDDDIKLFTLGTYHIELAKSSVLNIFEMDFTVYSENNKITYYT